MTTLTSAPLAPLLARLFKEAEAATSPAAAGLSPDERARLLGSKTEYVDFYGRLKDLTVCYRCHSEFRGAFEHKAVAFDLHTADVLEMEYERRIGRR